MIKKKIKISGSSFLLPKSSSWQGLQDNYKLEFSRAKFNGKEIISDVKILLNTSD